MWNTRNSRNVRNDVKLSCWVIAQKVNGRYDQHTRNSRHTWKW
jgi:hypothetical protein